jgi:hypothetical protein
VKGAADARALNLTPSAEVSAQMGAKAVLHLKQSKIIAKHDQLSSEIFVFFDGPWSELIGKTEQEPTLGIAFELGAARSCQSVLLSVKLEHVPLSLRKRLLGKCQSAV